MATASLLKLTPYNPKQSTCYFPIQSPRNNNYLLPCFVKKQASNFAISCSSQNHPKFTPIKCCLTQIQPSSPPIKNDAPDNKIVHTILNLIHSLQKQVVAAILMAVLLLMYNPFSSAMAASGGRMGGSSFSSSSSSSSSSYSSSSSSDSSYSYSSSPSSSDSSYSYSSSPSYSYSSSPSYSYSSSPSSSSYSSRSLPGKLLDEYDVGEDEYLPKIKFKKYILIEELHTIMSPGSGFSYSVVPPFSAGGGEGVVDLGHGIGLSLLFILMCLAAIARFADDGDEASNRPCNDGLRVTVTEKTSVVKLQVGLSGLGGRTLQGDLNRIAETADTSTRTGLSYVLTETVVALLRHPSYCISGYTSVDIKRGMEDVETHFNRLSIEERGKFDEETLVNVNNIKRQQSKIKSQRASSGVSNDYLVITILVAAEGIYELPTIKGSGDLTEALHKLGSLPWSKTLAVEVLWTPQNENDTLSERELLEDYPLLRPL